MNDIINKLRMIDPNALHVLQKVLETRSSSKNTNMHNLALKSEVQRGYTLLAQLIHEIAEPIEHGDEDDTVIRDNRVLDWSHFQNG